MAASILDSIILVIFSVLVNRLLFGSLAPADPGSILALTGMAFLLQWAVSASYESLFVAWFGATPGKMAVRLQVVTAGGARLSLGRSIGRYFAKMVSGFTLCIGYIIVAFDDEKRGLHDYICSTRVIKSPK